MIYCLLKWASLVFSLCVFIVMIVILVSFSKWLSQTSPQKPQLVLSVVFFFLFSFPAPDAPVSGIPLPYLCV